MEKLDLINTNIKKLFFKYLITSIGGTFVTSIYILADTIIIGKGVGAEGIVALNIILPLFMFFFGTGDLFGVGGAVLMSFANGRKDKKLADTYFTSAVIFTALFSMLYLVFCTIYFDKIAYLLGSDEQSITLVREYGRIIVIGAPLFMVSTLLQAFVRNDKNPKLAMIAVISGGVLNVLLDYLFVFIFRMGISGAAIATLIGTATTLVILLTHFVSKNNTIKCVRGAFKFRIIANIVQSGASSFLIVVANGIVILIFNIQLISYIGEIGIVVYGIISNCAIVAMSLFNGIAQATQPIMSVNFGAKKIKRVLEVRRLGFITTFFIGILLFLSGVLFPRVAISVFVKPTEDILLLGTNAIRIYFVAFLMMNINILYSSYFQCVMRPISSLVICFLRGLILSIALVYLLPIFFGVSGIWAVMPLTEFITVIIAFIIVKKTDGKLASH